MVRGESSGGGEHRAPRTRDRQQAPAKIGGYRKPLLADHEVLLRELVESRKGITLAEIRDELTARGIRSGSLSTIWTTLRRLGLSHKKSLQGGRADPA